eukprot:TRINITY_DN28649_c0_g1_i1.p1 TRINITY_DN28649_c0_g1~~TRINITY_DN28649_c0_g1_i1.p1  ORF type:complete len:439 (+),score=78.84 TRINITY_DN28649_c0_g1_i1:61-1377(+)
MEDQAGLRRRTAAAEPPSADNGATAAAADGDGASAASEAAPPEPSPPAEASAAAPTAAAAACEAHGQACKRQPTARQLWWQAVFRQVMLSTPFKLATFSVVATVPVFGLFALPTMLEKAGIEDGRGHIVFAAWISIQFLFNFFMTQHTDAGTTRGIEPTGDAKAGQFLLVLDAAEGASESTSLLYAPNYCEKCRWWKPPRTHHCTVCQRCTLRMDHHCPFTGTCIGMRNHGYFFLMYVFAMIGISYSAIMCCIAVHKQWSWTVRPDSWRNHLVLPSSLGSLAIHVLDAVGVAVAVQTFLTSVALLAVFGCGCPALGVVAGGMTMIEMRFPMKEYVQLEPKVYCPLGAGFYARSRRKNIEDILGPRWVWRLLVPWPFPNLSLEPAISPQPSTLGCEAIRQRVQQVKEQGVQQTVQSCRDLGFNPGPAATTAAAEATAAT